jgi:F0F1-type ATP synthase assembly protein I
MTSPGPEKPGGMGRKLVRDMGPFLTLGLQLALTVVVFFFLGRWLDQEFGTAPWLMLAGLFVGVTGGLIAFFRTVIRLGARSDDDES